MDVCTSGSFAARICHEPGVVSQHAASINRVAPVEEQVVVGDEDWQHVGRKSMGCEVAGDNPVNELPAMKANRGLPSPKSMAKASKKSAVLTVGAMIGAARRTCHELERRERIEERYTLHSIAPLRSASGNPLQNRPVDRWASERCLSFEPPRFWGAMMAES